MDDSDIRLTFKDSTGKREEGECMGFEGVYCTTPTGKILNSEGITIKVFPNDRLLLMGPSGCGKSSLLRVLSGLWTHSEGTVTYPGKENIMFLPQKAYMVLGNLRDQLIYPELFTLSTPSNSELEKYFQLAKLDYLLKRFNWEDKEIWNSVLSPGEQQRLSFARLFYHNPKFAVLDESTSALDPYNEDEMYLMCQKLGTGIISVGHRESLIDHHTLILKFDGKGGWELMKKDNGKGRGHKISIQKVSKVRSSIGQNDRSIKQASEATEHVLGQLEARKAVVKLVPIDEDDEEESF